MAGLLYCKRTIWGYFVEIWTGDKLYVRKENGTYNESVQVVLPGFMDYPGCPCKHSSQSQILP